MTCYMASNSVMVMDGWNRIWKEAVVSCFKVASRKLPGGVERITKT